MKLSDFKPTAKQKAAFDELVKAAKKCKRLGLELYGKQESLFAFRSDAMGHAQPLAESPANHEHPIPGLSAHILTDSGADDMEYFQFGVITEEE